MAAEAQSPAATTTAPAEAAPAAAQPGALGIGWSTQVTPAAPKEPGGDIVLTPEQTEIVSKINDYFNGVVYLQGRFNQINADGTTTHGKFYVRRPGRLRFDYAAPSKLRIVADGRNLSIEDHDLKTVDQFPLESTPFRLLLEKDVNLLRDAKITTVARQDDYVAVVMEDKKEGSQGRLQLFFTAKDYQLLEWVISDPQGLDTRIQVSNLEQGKEVAEDFFKASGLDFHKF
ncbi:MAG: outer-membrane lipoprotein carrier protein LolA [Pseudomonadota bacterium]|nr:outer-membrane lipoprotein carrier protein LolA [Pseudomonadota bacterium]